MWLTLSGTAGQVAFIVTRLAGVRDTEVRVR
jgi:hypothetical protein